MESSAAEAPVQIAATVDNILSNTENANNENREIELHKIVSENDDDGNSNSNLPRIPTDLPSDSSDLTSNTEPAKQLTDTDDSNSGIPTKTDAQTPDESVLATSDDSSYASHVTYNNHGVAIYTDPSSSEQFEFDAQQNEWIPVSEANRLPVSQSSNVATATRTDDPYENEFYRWCHVKQQWIPKTTAKPTAEGDDSEKDDEEETTAATDETDFYKYDASKNLWIPKASGRVVTSTPTETNDCGDAAAADSNKWEHTYRDEDGAVFVWDGEKRAWFPKIDDDFMAQYQMGYGNYEASDEEAQEEEELNILERMLHERIHGKADGNVAAASEGEADPDGEEQQAKAKAKRKAAQSPPSECCDGVWFIT